MTRKTANEARQLADVIKEEADGLPDVDFFGGSNEEAKAESYAWAKALELYAADGTVPGPDCDKLLEVRIWITGEGWSCLSDYE